MKHLNALNNTRKERKRRERIDRQTRSRDDRGAKRNPTKANNPSKFANKMQRAQRRRMRRWVAMSERNPSLFKWFDTLSASKPGRRKKCERRSKGRPLTVERVYDLFGRIVDVRRFVDDRVAKRYR